MNTLPAEDLCILQLICQTLFDKKGFNILSLDVRGLSSLTDYFVIAEGNVEKHVQTLAKQVIDAMASHGRSPIHVEGRKEGDWVVIDFSEVIIHLFIPDLREKYALEALWHHAQIVDVSIHVTLPNR